MTNFKIKINRILFYLRYRDRLVVFLLSILSLTFILLNLIDIFHNFLNILILGMLIQFCIHFSTIFTLLILPTYPVYFIIFKKIDFNFIEKLSLTIVSNLSFYIIGGFIGFFIGFPITGLYFFLIVFISYFLILIYILITNYKKKVLDLLKPKELELNNQHLYANFSIVQYLKDLISINDILLITFISLTLILYLVSVPLFVGTDSWLHISIIKQISVVNYLPVKEYTGSMGLHIFGAVIHMFSGLDIILIPRYFIFYTFPVSSLIVYNLFRRIFKNKNLALLGVYILNFSSLGFIILMYQFWPTSIAYIQGIFIFYLLYIRYKRYIQFERPTTELLKADLLFSHITIILVFISSLLTHSLIILILLICYLWIYFVYFVKDPRRGLDFILLCVLVGIFLIFFSLNISMGYFKVFRSIFQLPWYYLLSGALGIAVVIFLLTLHERKALNFTKGRYKLIIMGKKYSYYKTIEDKFIIPFIFGAIISFTIIFVIVNLLFLKIGIFSIFSVFEILLFVFFGLWGLILFQNKPKGKIFGIWALILILILLASLIFSLLINSFIHFSRIFYISSVILVVGFISYIYKLIKTNSIRTLRVKFLIFFIIIFSIFATFNENRNAIEIFTLKNREISSVQWYSNYTSEKNVIIGEVGWNHLFIYFNFPFEDYDENHTFSSIQKYIPASDTLMRPDNHVNEYGKNNLKQIKLHNNNSNTFLILTDNYLLTEGLSLFGQLTDEEVEQYYNLDYLNRIFSVKNENGESTSYYWVI